MKTYKIQHYLTIIALSVSAFSLPLEAQNPSPEATETAQSASKPRPLPYRGVVGTIDLKKKTFTLKNKSNTEPRVFQVDQKTRFDLGTSRKALEDLKPNMQITGSCIKTGERHYLARLVRWKSTPEKAKNESKKTNSSPPISPNSKK